MHLPVPNKHIGGSVKTQPAECTILCLENPEPNAPLLHNKPKGVLRAVI